MSDIDTSGLRSALRVTRTVRRGQFVGRAAGEAGGGGGLAEPGTIAASGLALIVSGAEYGPEAMAALAGLVAVGALAQFYQPNLGGIVFPDNIHRPWEYADKVRRLTLERLYGTEKGDNVWNSEWSQRSIQIDLRSRAP